MVPDTTQNAEQKTKKSCPDQLNWQHDLRRARSWTGSVSQAFEASEPARLAAAAPAQVSAMDGLVLK